MLLVGCQYFCLLIKRLEPAFSDFRMEISIQKHEGLHGASLKYSLPSLFSDRGSELESQRITSQTWAVGGDVHQDSASGLGHSCVLLDC